jgi:hypothetical protein
MWKASGVEVTGPEVGNCEFPDPEPAQQYRFLLFLLLCNETFLNSGRRKGNPRPALL